MTDLKQKRCKKTKMCEANVENVSYNNNDSCIILEELQHTTTVEPVIHKKRGRKPKGGKIINQLLEVNNNIEVKPNIILHLKCSLKDLIPDTQTSINKTQMPSESESESGSHHIESFNFSSKNDLSFEIIETMSSSSKEDNDDEPEDDKYEIKEIWKKLKQLEHNLHINNICDKKSACFWCTCDFDNPSIYIPKFHIRSSYHVYGCFCSPECACAYLMDENIDSSTKFERYYLLNHIYSQIYNYNKNIKPAPNPYYMLDKYYGNLTIQEYRMLFRNERLFFVVEKPLTRVLPELHEDNNDFIITNKIIPSNKYQIKKKNQKKNPTKNTIVNETFGSSSAS